MLVRSLIAVSLFCAAPCFANDANRLSIAQIADTIVKESRQAYYKTGHPCACPYDLARHGSRCGRRSAYTRPGGASPKCYPDRDVSESDIARYRALHPR